MIESVIDGDKKQLVTVIVISPEAGPYFKAYPGKWDDLSAVANLIYRRKMGKNTNPKRLAKKWGWKVYQVMALVIEVGEFTDKHGAFRASDDVAVIWADSLDDDEKIVPDMGVGNWALLYGPYSNFYNFVFGPKPGEAIQ